MILRTVPGSAHEIVGPGRAVGVAQEPEQERIAQILGGQKVDAGPVTLFHGMLRDGGIIRSPRPGAQIAARIGDGFVRRGL